MNDKRRETLLDTYLGGLLNDTLPFWLQHSIDREHGGFLTSLDADGTLVDPDKGVWQQARFTWLLGELYNNIEPKDEWLELAKHGIEFIDKHCFDQNDGRMWFHLTRDGRPIRKRRYSFSESFAAIAYGEFAKATGSDEYTEKAKRTFKQFVEHNLDTKGTQPKFTDVRPTRSLGFPMITIATAQELRESIGLEDANEWIDHSIASIRSLHLKEDIQCVMETVSPTGEIIDSYDGRTLNPGHAIEGAWFIMQEGSYRNDRDLIDMGCKMLDWMWARGWDQEHGGLYYFRDVFNRPVQEYWHDMKFWWPHNETIIATLMAWELSNEQKYADWHQLVHDWAYEFFPDRTHGEWYGYLQRDGSISSTAKGNLWKGPFHLPRMQLVCSKTLNRQMSKNESRPLDS